jgi:hypothetical protein
MDAASSAPSSEQKKANTPRSIPSERELPGIEAAITQDFAIIQNLSDQMRYELSVEGCAGGEPRELVLLNYIGGYRSVRKSAHARISGSLAAIDYQQNADLSELKNRLNIELANEFQAALNGSTGWKNELVRTIMERGGNSCQSVASKFGVPAFDAGMTAGMEALLELADQESCKNGFLSTLQVLKQAENPDLATKECSLARAREIASRRQSRTKP